MCCEFHGGRETPQQGDDKSCDAENCPTGGERIVQPIEEDDARNDSFFAKVKQFFKFLGPAVLISVGYVDPGNWATDIAGGAIYQYKMLWVLLAANAIAIVVQSLAAKLGLVTGKDLAQQCSNYYPRKMNIFLWVLAELAIGATDLVCLLGADKFLIVTQTGRSVGNCYRPKSAFQNSNDLGSFDHSWRYPVVPRVPSFRTPYHGVLHIYSHGDHFNLLHCAHVLCQAFLFRHYAWICYSLFATWKFSNCSGHLRSYNYASQHVSALWDNLVTKDKELCEDKALYQFCNH